MKRLLTTIALALVAAPSAQADGLPLAVDTSPSGITPPSGRLRYLAVPARGDTVVATQHVGSGQIFTSHVLRGRFGVPAVAYDGTPSGVSADRRTLVLIRPRRGFPRARTTFAVMDTKAGPLRLRRLIHLHGDFSFDALSPDGDSMFLIHYISRRDPSRYRVRVYDLRTDRLLPKPIVDPNEDPDEMNGYPATRETSADGRWEYTLYQGNEHPFVHALDTRERRAVCIDLDDVHESDLYRLDMELSPSGEQLTVSGRHGPQALVDTRSFEVTPAPSAAGAADAESSDGGPPWALLGAGAGLLLLAGGAVANRRSRRGGAAARASTDAPDAWLDVRSEAGPHRPAGNGSEPERHPAHRSGS